MRKRLKLIISMSVILIIIAGISMNIYCDSFFGSSCLEIEILNRTDYDLNEMRIEYKGVESPIILPEVEKRGESTINISPDEDFVENELYLIYKDMNGKEHQDVIVGYFEKGNYGKVQVKILYRYPDGQMVITSDYNLEYLNYREKS